MRKNAFFSCHPLVVLMYFVSVIGFSCFFIHPVCLGVSFFCGLSWALYLLGWKKVGKSLCYLLPVIAVTALMNPLFNHQGITVLGYLPSGNPLTGESVLYGLLAGTMVAEIFLWFLCYREVMTDDKTAYLFGRIAPTLALLFSMTLRFVPEFLNRFRQVRRARRGMKMQKGGKLSEAMLVFSGVTTWALENAVDTADSMKARGYGLPGRTSYHPVRFDCRDGISLGWILAFAGTVLVGGWLNRFEFRCFPMVMGSGISTETLPFFLGFFLLCSYPFCLEAWEVRRWNVIASGD